MEMTKYNKEKFQIDSYSVNQTTESIHQELLGVLDHFYYTVGRVDLLNDRICLLQCAGHPECVSQVFNWSNYLEMSSGVYIAPDKTRVMESFSCAHLLKLYRDGEEAFSLDALYLKHGILNGMTLLALFKEVDGLPMAYVMVRNSSEDCLRKRIIDMYVYSSCDYFIYLDVKHNSYTMFSSNTDGTLLPPTHCDDYTAEIRKYADDVVLPEEREYVVWEMSLDRVLSRLEQQEVHSFHCSVNDPVRGYTRKRFDYRYYERSTQMILLSCTDVTELYNEEMVRRKTLFEALQRAQTDALTGLLNYQGTIENISNDLKNGLEHAALLFVDLDNFKQVNDTLGHMTGDYVLTQVASILRREAVGMPHIGRFGGDEFIVFFSNVHSLEDITAYAQRVCRSVAALDYGQRTSERHVTCSIGIAEAFRGDSDYKALIKRADDMAYQSKSAGKNRYMVHPARKHATFE